MSKFNFDSEFYRRVISKNDKTIKVPYLCRTLKEATEVFYNEFDYYPEFAVYAPGTFTILGDHLEYLKGNLIQAALPIGTVIVGKPFCSVKCKLLTTLNNGDSLKKYTFSILQFKKKTDMFPPWMNYIKGVINCFPYKGIKGFDVVIHSNVPIEQGFGSSAALQVGFYTFLEAATGEKICQDKIRKGCLCWAAETLSQPCTRRIGKFNNYTSSVALANCGVKINCRTREISTFNMKDPNILFLLIYPNFEIELNDRDYVERRELELIVAAKLLGLKDIIDATLEHLNVLVEMQDPTKEEVRRILRDLHLEEELIEDFVEDLFYFPKSQTISEFETEMAPEDDYLDIESQEGEKDEETQRQRINTDIFPGEYIRDDIEEEKTCKEPCKKLKPVGRWAKPVPFPRPVSYIHQRIAELCEGKIGPESNVAQKICEEINCLGGLENLSSASDMTVCGKLLRRVRHVVTENLRSLSLPQFISEGDYVEFGLKLIQSHLSLKLDYEVSCPTLDSLVELALESNKIYGAKMFSGGGTLTLLHRTVAEEFVEKVINKFGDRFQFYLVFPGSGAKIINLRAKPIQKSLLSHVFPNKEELLRKAVENFIATYKYRPTYAAYSPTVLNLIGDHADYNHGLSISVAINMTTIVVGAYNGTSKIRAATTVDTGDDNKKVIFSILDNSDPEKFGNARWETLLQGVTSKFQEFLKGFDCLIETSLPDICGMTNKCGLATAFYTLLEELSERPCFSDDKKAHECMLAIQEFTHTVCGVGELSVSIKSKEDFACLFDSRSTVNILIPFQNPSVSLLLSYVSSPVPSNRALLYKRMEECYEVAKALGGKTLRCLTLKDLDGLDKAKRKVRPESILRAQHVITENERVFKAAEALKNGDFETLGEIMVASHNSLRDNFAVVNPQIDRLVATAMEVDGVLGSKAPYCGYMTCTLSLVKRWAVDDLIEYLQNNTSLKLNFYLVNTCNGCGLLDVEECLKKFPSPHYVFEDIFPY